MLMGSSGGSSNSNGNGGTVILCLIFHTVNTFCCRNYFPDSLLGIKNKEMLLNSSSTILLHIMTLIQYLSTCLFTSFFPDNNVTYKGYCSKTLS